MIINFIKPISKKGNRSIVNKSDGYLNAYIKGKNRKQNCFELNIKNFLSKKKLGWKFIQVGYDENNAIYICEGTSENSYLISMHNKSICNRILVEKLIEKLNLRMPIKPDELVKVNFNLQKIEDSNIYQLIKI